MPVCCLKMGVLLVVTLVLYENKKVFNYVFAPTAPLLGFHDPLHPEFTDAMHEWYMFALCRALSCCLEYVHCSLLRALPTEAILL